MISPNTFFSLAPYLLAKRCLDENEEDEEVVAEEVEEEEEATVGAAAGLCFCLTSSEGLNLAAFFSSTLSSDGFACRLEGFFSSSTGRVVFGSLLVSVFGSNFCSALSSTLAFSSWFGINLAFGLRFLGRG